jgi:hypothetical protein
MKLGNVGFDGVIIPLIINNDITNYLTANPFGDFQPKQ